MANIFKQILMNVYDFCFVFPSSVHLAKIDS